VPSPCIRAIIISSADSEGMSFLNTLGNWPQLMANQFFVPVADVALKLTPLRRPLNSPSGNKNGVAARLYVSAILKMLSGLPRNGCAVANTLRILGALKAETPGWRC